MRHGHVSRSMFNVRLTFLSGRTLSLWVGSRPLGCRALLHLFFGGGTNRALPADALTSCLLCRFAWHAGCSPLFVCFYWAPSSFVVRNSGFRPCEHPRYGRCPWASASTTIGVRSSIVVAPNL